MGSMRQLASMFRHVHEAHGLGVAEDSSGEALLLAPGDADFAHAGAEDEPARDNGNRPFQQN